MTPLEIILEDAAEWVRDILNTHWTVLLLPLSWVALFFAGLLAGKSRTITLYIAILLAPFTVHSATNSVLATFDPSSSPASYISNYTIGYGQVSRGTNPLFSYPSNLVFSKTNLSVTVSNLGPGQWFFSANAISTNGLTSYWSNEEGWTNRVFGPQNLRIQGPQDALALQSSGDGINWKTLAVIVSSNQPLVVAAQARSFFRTTNTSLPPLPFSR